MINDRILGRVKINSTYLAAGIHEQCILANYESISDSSKNKQTFMTFVKLDDEEKEIGRTIISWFIFDHNGEFIFPNFQEYMVQLDGILSLYYSKEEIDATFRPFRDTDVEARIDIQDQIKRKSELKTMFKNVHDDLEVLLAPIVARYEAGDYSKRNRLKLVLKRGYVNPPSYGNFVESMDISREESVLKLTIPEQKEIDKDKSILGISVEEKDKPTKEAALANMENLDNKEIYQTI